MAKTTDRALVLVVGEEHPLAEERLVQMGLHDPLRIRPDEVRIVEGLVVAKSKCFDVE